MSKTITYWPSILVYTLVLFLTCTTIVNAQQKEANNIHIERLDKTLFEEINKPSQKQSQYITENSSYIIVALAQTINSTANSTNSIEILKKYYSNPQLNTIYKDALKEFENLGKYEKELTQMYELARKELNTIKPPFFSVHISGFKENTIYINNTISLSLDKYMGIHYNGYKGYFKPYQLQQMQPQMIVKDMTKAWLMADYIKTETTSGDLLSEMVEQGKLLYTLSILLPQYSEQDLMGYTTNEYNWCTNNQKKIWTNIIKQNHLYTTDRHVIHTYFDDAPNNKAFPQSLSGKLGTWIGFQIVKQYARERKQTVKTMIHLDSRIILKESKFKP